MVRPRDDAHMGFKQKTQIVGARHTTNTTEDSPRFLSSDEQVNARISMRDGSESPSLGCFVPNSTGLSYFTTNNYRTPKSLILLQFCTNEKTRLWRASCVGRGTQPLD